MKNLSKKIGAGVVASSLILGGAVSTGLVANAYSGVQSQVEQTGKYKYDTRFDVLDNEFRKELGDLEVFRGAKDMFNFRVFGYYLGPSAQRNRMKWDIDEFIRLLKVKFGDNNEKYQQIKKVLEGEIPQEFKFTYAKEFLSYLCNNGMDEGVKKVQIGEAEVILVFNKEVQPIPKDTLSEDTIKKWRENWRAKWGVNQLQVSDIEARDHLDIINEILELRK